MAELFKQITITVDTEKGTIKVGELETKFRSTTRAAKELQRQIDDNTGKFGRTENVIKKEIQLRTQLRAATAGDTAEYQKQSVAIIQLENELKDLTNTQELVAKSANNMRDKTGLAGAAAVEIGRTISDANYGFTAMANNISQLSTLMITLVATTKGVKNAASELIKVLRGPIGFIVAFQIIITLFEKFKKDQKEVSDGTKDLTKSLNANIVVANKYVSILEDVNISEEKRATTIKELKKLIPTLKDEDFKYGEQLDNVRKKINDYNLAQASRIEIDKLVEKNSEILSKQRRINVINEIENEEEKVEAIKKLLHEENVSLRTLNKEKFEISKAGNIIYTEERLKTIDELKKDFQEISKTIDAESKPILDKLEELTKGFEFGTGEDDKKGGRGSKKDFVARELSFANEILKSEDRIAKKTTRNQFERLEQEEQIQKELARIKLKEFADREKARAAAIKDPKDRAKAVTEANYAIGRAEQSLAQYEIQLEEETKAKRLEILRSSLEEQLGLMTEYSAKEREAVLSFDVSMATNEIDKIEAERNLEDERLKNKLNALDIEKQKRIENGELYGDIILQEQNAVNESERVKTKLREKEEKTRLAIANQVANAIIGIAGEGSAVGKAVAVAMAIMNTKEAITAALGAKPYGPWNIAQAIAVGAFGFKQVQDILSTKIPSKAGSGASVSAGGAGITTQAPDFNVVGAGQTSQLAQSLAGVTGRPVKAFVVSKEISSAQELDRNISNNAELG
jgi:hypothetical protein